MWITYKHIFSVRRVFTYMTSRRRNPSFLLYWTYSHQAYWTHHGLNAVLSVLSPLLLCASVSVSEGASTILLSRSPDRADKGTYFVGSFPRFASPRVPPHVPLVLGCLWIPSGPLLVAASHSMEPL